MTGLFPDGVPTAEAALRDLTSEKHRVRRAAAEALGDVSDDELVPRAREALIRATDDLRPEVRSAAVLSLGELGGKEAAEAITRCLDDGNSEVRQSAAVALGSAGDLSSVPALIKALEEGSADLRFQAATSLAEVDANAAREPLLARLQHEDDAEVVAACALALGAIGEHRAIEPLSALLDKHGRKTQFDVAYALADLGDERAAEPLASFLGDEIFGWDAIVAMEKLAPTLVSAPLAATFAGQARPNALTIRAAGAVLRLGEGTRAKPARDFLISGLGARKVEHRGLAIELLGELGSTWALEALAGFRGKWAARRLRDEIDAALSEIRDRDA